MNQDQVFAEAKERYFRQMSNMHYVFQMTKCCEHFEWIALLKSFTCADMYRYVRQYLETTKPFMLFVKDIHGNKLEISESECVLKSLLLGNPSFFKPVYSLPHPVVYKLFLDDGHLCHPV